MALLFPVIGVYGSFYSLLDAIVEVAEEVDTSALLEFLDGYIVVLALRVVGRPDAEGTIGIGLLVVSQQCHIEVFGHDAGEMKAACWLALFLGNLVEVFLVTDILCLVDGGSLDHIECVALASPCAHLLFDVLPYTPVVSTYLGLHVAQVERLIVPGVGAQPVV